MGSFFLLFFGVVGGGGKGSGFFVSSLICFLGKGASRFIASGKGEEEDMFPN